LDSIAKFEFVRNLKAAKTFGLIVPIPPLGRGAALVKIVLGYEHFTVPIVLCHNSPSALMDQMIYSARGQPAT
jgi:hypothetical protein